MLLAIRGCPRAGAERMDKRNRTASRRRTARRAALGISQRRAAMKWKAPARKWTMRLSSRCPPAGAGHRERQVGGHSRRLLDTDRGERGRDAGSRDRAFQHRRGPASLSCRIPGPKPQLPVLLVSVAGLAARLPAAGPDHAHGKEDPDLFRIASGIEDLARRIAWTWLELWERKHRKMGEILRAILEDERAYWSSVYRRET